MGGHEDASATLLSRALTPQAVDLAIVVHTVVLEGGQLDLAMLVLDLLGGGVVLLLALLAATAQAEDKMEGGLCKMLNKLAVCLGKQELHCRNMH